jgi:hypothetical protein
MELKLMLKEHTHNFNIVNNNLETLIKRLVFGNERACSYDEITKLARSNGIFPASIQSLYEQIGKGYFKGFTVPAINIQGITFDFTKAIFRALVKNRVGACIFEIVRSEKEHTRQSPVEVAGCILTAAIAEGYTGPVFLQGDNLQVNRASYFENPRKELNELKQLIQELVSAGFYNIDIDASTLVNIEKTDLLEQQELNSLVTAELTGYIRSIQPANIMVSIGGELGKIGEGSNTTEDFRAFMERYRYQLTLGQKGISKISAKTNNSSNGVIESDATIGEAKVDFETLKKLSIIAREEYNLGGVVQHGSLTLPDEMFDIFPKQQTLEIHLATGFQNIIFESRHFPDELRDKIYTGLFTKYGSYKKENESQLQFYCRYREKAFVDFKRDLWDMEDFRLIKIGEDIENRFSFLFQKLNVISTNSIIKQRYYTD